MSEVKMWMKGYQINDNGKESKKVGKMHANAMPRSEK